MVACHGKFRMLCLHSEIGEETLLGEFVAKSHAIVIHTESKIHKSTVGWLFQFHKHFVVVVTNTFLFAPHRLPCFIKSGCSHIINAKLIHQRVFFIQFHSQSARFHHSRALIINLIGGHAFVGE